MKRKQSYWVKFMMFLCLFMGIQDTCHGLEVGVAEPLPGFSPTRWVSFNYVTSDAQLLLFQVYDPYWRIKSSTWNANLQQWTSPQELPTDPPGGFPTSMIASLSPDGMTMYYGDGIQHGVCLSRKTENGWTLPIPPELAELVPNLDPAPSDTYFNGKYFYTTHFYNDIWVSTYDPVNDQFSPSEPVDSINTSEWSEQGAWISSDNNLLVFSSNRPGGYGHYDLYSATWDEDLKIWTNITNLGPNVNTPSDEYNSCMAEEAGILFFERHDPVTDERQPMQAFVEPESLVVNIDIKPGSYPNTINLGSHGLVPIAILSDEEFDATTVDPDSVELAGADVAVRGKSNRFVAHEEDVNGDELLDLVVQVATANLDPDSFQNGYAVLTGKTYDGQSIEGSDEITIVPMEE